MTNLLLLIFVLLLLVYFALWLFARLVLEGEDLRKYDSLLPSRVTERAVASPAAAEADQLILSMVTNPIRNPKAKRLKKTRQRFDRGFFAMDAETLGVQFRSVELEGITGEWVVAEDCLPGHRVLYLHGGGFIMGSAQSHRIITSQIAKKTRHAVLAINYSLLPEATRLDAVEDCYRAFGWLSEHGPTGTAPADRLVIGGDSAGGNLTLVTIALLRDRGARQADAVLAIGPSTDMTLSSPTLQRNARSDKFLGRLFAPLRFIPRPILLIANSILVGNGLSPSHPYISPIFGDLANLPPILIHASESECLWGDALRFANKARASGTEVTLQSWPGLPHVWHLFQPILPEAEEAFENIANWVGARS